MFFELVESPWIRAGRQYSVRVRQPLSLSRQRDVLLTGRGVQDLWTHTDNGTAVRNFTARAVPAHGVVALLLQDAGDEPANAGPPCEIAENCVSEDGMPAQ